MRLLLTIPLVLAVMGCKSDETVAAYGAGDKTWALQEINGTAFPETATLIINGDEQRISGKAPCNSYSAEQSAPYPWFKPGPIAVTRRACIDMAPEQTYLEALARMTIAEVSGDVLILSNDAGDQMVFAASAAE